MLKGKYEEQKLFKDWHAYLNVHLHMKHVPFQEKHLVCYGRLCDHNIYSYWRRELRPHSNNNFPFFSFVFFALLMSMIFLIKFSFSSFNTDNCCSVDLVKCYKIHSMRCSNFKTTRKWRERKRNERRKKCEKSIILVLPNKLFLTFFRAISQWNAFGAFGEIIISVFCLVVDVVGRLQITRHTSI